MTAKPQPMAGQSGASDDLIAELAKLMAQDARSEKPAELSSPVLTVRIPGGDTSAIPVPRFDPERSPTVDETFAVAAPPAPVSGGVSTASAPEPAPVEPFHFDFGLVAPKVTPAPPPAAAVQVDVPAAPVVNAPDPGFMPVDHDTIADLIAAELMGLSGPVDEAPLPAPVVPATAYPAPKPSTNWAPTAVSASLGTPEKSMRPAMRPLNLQPAPRPEQDRFKVAPVFGLGSAEPSIAPPVSQATPPVVATTPPDSAPLRSEPTFGWRQPAPAGAPDQTPVLDDDSTRRDPIDEIESLIGNAMRVELARSGEVAATASQWSAPSPALRSLATPTLPAARPASTNRAMSGADEAIIAAAEAAGVEIGWVDAPRTAGAEPTAPRRQRAPRGMGITRALAGPLVAVTLLLAAGFGLYWVLGLGREAGPVPLLTADTSPTKVTPVVDPAEAAPAQSVVFNEIDGVVPGAEEQLVSRDQSDLNEVTQVPATPELSEEGLANRRVRTVTVRPDGTIVSGEDSVAGSNILPVARPNIPAVPGTETASPELLASTTPLAATSATATPTTTTPTTATPVVETPVTPAPAEPEVTPVTPGATVPAVDLGGNPLAGRTTVVPLIRPAGLEGPGAASFSAATSPINAVVNGASAGGNMLPPPPTASAFAAAAAPTTAAAPAATPATAQPVEVAALGNTAPAYVQLASQRSEEEARTTAQGMVTRFGPLFGGANLEVQRVDLGERGIYYRVRVPATSVEDANNICTNVKAAGGDCFTM